MLEPADRRLLKWIAVSTTFLAAAVALGIVLTIVSLVLVHVGGHSGVATVFTYTRTTP